MKYRRKLIGLLALAALLISSCTTANNSTQPLNEKAGGEQPEVLEGKQSAGNSNEEIQKFHDQLVAALENAKKTGKTSVDITTDYENPNVVQVGDIVRVRYKATMDDGRVITLKQNAEPGSNGFKIASIIAGKSDQLPGLSRSVLGKKIGVFSVVIPPEQGFGLHMDEKLKQIPLTRTVPVTVSIAKQKFIDKFNKPPTPGEPIEINPFFESVVIGVTDKKIIVKNLAKDGTVDQTSFGSTYIAVVDDTITMTLKPIIGSDFAVGDKKGRITVFDDTTFTVDMNHPLAGQSIYLEGEVKSITKKSVFQDYEISWITDHDSGYEIAMENHKDTVLVLYADWCQWCKKLLAETFEDPRIKMLKDRFVFVKANSNEDPSLKELYEQKGFPMIVLTDYKGNVYKKTEGFKDASHLLNDLEQILNSSSS